MVNMEIENEHVVERKKIIKYTFVNPNGFKVEVKMYFHLDNTFWYEINGCQMNNPEKIPNLHLQEGD